MPKTAKKRIARKAVRKPPPKRPLKFNLKIGSSDDPFWIDQATIPNGVALQWVTCEVNGDQYPRLLYEANAAGWNTVPNQEKVSGQVLMWAPKEVSKAQKNADIDRAKKQIADIRALFGMDGSKPSPFHGSVPIVGPDFVESQVYERVPSDAQPVDVEVAIKVRVSAQWQDAAAGLGLQVGEYTRRRILMDHIVLGPCFLYDDFLGKGRVYEPVNLFTKRID